MQNRIGWLPAYVRGRRLPAQPYHEALLELCNSLLRFDFSRNWELCKKEGGGVRRICTYLYVSPVPYIPIFVSLAAPYLYGHS